MVFPKAGLPEKEKKHHPPVIFSETAHFTTPLLPLGQRNSKTAKPFSVLRFRPFYQYYTA
jgi:hypothetical protein